MDYIREHYITLVLTSIYVAGCLYIGWHFKKKAKQGVEGYFVAKREIPGWVISLAFFSTSASTNTYIGQAGIGRSLEGGKSYLGSPAGEAREKFRELAHLRSLPSILKDLKKQ